MNGTAYPSPQYDFFQKMNEFKDLSPTYYKSLIKYLFFLTSVLYLICCIHYIYLKNVLKIKYEHSS